jgi:hypothetical protein
MGAIFSYEDLYEKMTAPAIIVIERSSKGVYAGEPSNTAIGAGASGEIRPLKMSVNYNPKRQS